VEGSGYSVAQHLPVGFHEGQGVREVNSGTGHELALEGVSVQIHDAGQYLEPLGVENDHVPAAHPVFHGAFLSDGQDGPAAYHHRSPGEEFSSGQDVSPGYEQL
jgi:hypothetical protein